MRRIVAGVKSYVVELQVPAGDATDVAERARSAAEQLAGEGIAVRWVRSVYVPEEESCLVVFETATDEGGHPT